MLSLIRMNITVQDALIAANRLFEVMDLEPEETVQKMELTGEMAGPVCFKGVTFRYGSRPAVFEDLNLCFTKGVITARLEEHTSELLSLMRISYAFFCLKIIKLLLIFPTSI